jgi:hypothetical protein
VNMEYKSFVLNELNFNKFDFGYYFVKGFAIRKFSVAWKRMRARHLT